MANLYTICSTSIPGLTFFFTPGNDSYYYVNRRVNSKKSMVQTSEKG